MQIETFKPWTILTVVKILSVIFHYHLMTIIESRQY